MRSLWRRWAEFKHRLHGRFHWLHCAHDYCHFGYLGTILLEHHGAHVVTVSVLMVVSLGLMLLGDDI